MAVLTTPLRTWTFDCNNTQVALGSAGATNQRVMRTWWATEFVALGFALDRSCDSAVAGTLGDGVERWLADANVVFNTPGSAHSWRVHDMPSIFGGGQICVDCDGSSAGTGGVSIFLSFTANGFTGGSTTARPTATDEFEITVTSQLLPTTNNDLTWHWMLASAEGSLRLFMYTAGSAAGPTNVLMVERLSDAPSAFSPPVVAASRFATGGAGDFGDWTDNARLSTRQGGSNRTGFMTVDEADLTRIQSSFTGNDLDGNKPIYAIGVHNATLGFLGTIDDLYSIADNATDFTNAPSGGTRLWINFDEFVTTWDGSSTLGGSSIDMAAHIAGIALADTGGGASSTVVDAVRRGRVEARITVPTGGWSVSVTANGGGAVTATVPAGNYYLTSVSGDGLLAAFEAALEAATGTAWTVVASLGELGTGITTITGAGSWSIAWTSTDLRDTLGYTGNLGAGTGARSGSNHVIGAWLPDVAMHNDLGSSDAGRRKSDARYARSPRGHVKTLVGQLRRELGNLRWDYVTLRRTRQRAEVVTNEALETFWRNCHVGEKSYFPAGAHLRIFKDADLNTVLGVYKVVGWQDCPGEPAVTDWDGLWRVTMPNLFEVPS